MKKLRAPKGPFVRQAARDAEIASLIESDPRFAGVAAQIWSDVTGGDGVLIVDGKPVQPSDPMGVIKDLE